MLSNRKNREFYVYIECYLEKFAQAKKGLPHKIYLFSA